MKIYGTIITHVRITFIIIRAGTSFSKKLFKIYTHLWPKKLSYNMLLNFFFHKKPKIINILITIYYIFYLFFLKLALKKKNKYFNHKCINCVYE